MQNERGDSIRERAAGGFQLVFQLQPASVNETIPDAGGAWVVLGTAAVEQSSSIVAQLTAVKRVVAAGKASFPADMLTATIMFPTAPGGTVPPNLTIQGVKDAVSKDETGSVSSASPELAAYIGGSFQFSDADKILTINPAANAAQARSAGTYM
jgi:hypothetical protein